MGKQGPCYHCGVTSTPLWRNGPPEKPVLCNACGSRWRTKGSLVNYIPLHARPESENLEDSNKLWRVKAATPLKNKEPKILKRKFDKDVAAFQVSRPDSNHGFSKGFDEDTSNRSSSGSAISNSESFVADASDLTGPSQQPVVWDSTVPSRKRTCITRTKPSSVEKFTKDLVTLWHEQQQSLSLSGYPEEDLLLETDKPMVFVEIGHGSVLIKHPNSIAQEEESVASSLSFESKQDTVSSRQMVLAAPIVYNGAYTSCEVTGNIPKYDDKGIQEESLFDIRDKDQLAKLEIPNHHNSPPLHNIHLQDSRSQNNNIKASKPVPGLDGFDTNHSANMKRPQDVPLQKHTGQKIVFKSPSAIIKKLPYDQKELINKDGNSSKSNHLLPPHNDNGLPVMEASNFATESCDQDLLVDVPNNGSFPQAELLLPSSGLMY